MRILVGCLLIAAASLALAQSPQELRSRYGEPEGERFTPRPGISLSVEYGSDRLACRMLVEPLQPLLSHDEEARYMSSETVTDILEEVVPLATRGKQVMRAYLVSGCNEIEMTDYESLSIARSRHNCLPLKPERETRATVTFRRDACRSQPK